MSDAVDATVAWRTRSETSAPRVRRSVAISASSGLTRSLLARADVPSAESHGAGGDRDV